MVEAIKWQESGPGEFTLELLEQRLLPHEVRYIPCHTFQEVANAIREMIVRGAPAIGVSAAFGMALGANEYRHSDEAGFFQAMTGVSEILLATRPTAVNLQWALTRMEKILQLKMAREHLIPKLFQEAKAIFHEDIALCKSIGENGNSLVPRNAKILTHCNAGALATAGYGTALGVIRKAHESGKNISVWVDETRPYLQGARLTAWELMSDNIDCTLICDNMAGYLMGQKRVDMVIIGADRIAANGDAANKIGSYSLAILANYHKIPFFVAAPYSTIDMALETGEKIVIEERNPLEVTTVGFQNPVKIAPENVKVFNPSFDVVPNHLISALITDRGVFRPPFKILI